MGKFNEDMIQSKKVLLFILIGLIITGYFTFTIKNVKKPTGSPVKKIITPTAFRRANLDFPPQASGRQVAVLGDSLSIEGSYVSILSKKYNMNIDSYGSPSASSGWYPGDGVGDGTKNAFGLNYQFDTFIVKPGKKYDDVIVFGGFNDLNLRKPLETTESNLQSLYDAIHATGMRIIVISILPYRGCDCSKDKKNTKIQTLNHWIGTKAKHVDTFVDAYDYFFDSTRSAMIKENYYKDDGVHLKKEGYEKLAELIYKTAYQ